MKEKKTRKLVCNITGRSLLANKDYYSKKVEKAGSEEVLHSTYICQEAKTLLKKGHDLGHIRDILNVDSSFTCNLTNENAKEIVSGDNARLKFRLNNYDNSRASVIKTDPDVKQFIQNILRDE